MKFHIFLLAFLAGGLLSYGNTMTDEAVLREYVNRNLRPIMKKQEQVLGIRHRGVPNIKYGSCPAEGKDDCPLAQYLPETDTILMNSNSLELLAHSRTGEVKTTSFTKYVIDHELGHFYGDKLSEANGNGNWPALLQDGTYEDSGLAVAVEGVAAYFAEKMNPDHRLFSCDGQWPRSYSEYNFNPELYEEAGFCTVDPILAKYGRRGILYLFSDPTTEQDMLELDKYQERALRKLSKM
jgi:hypothetical protein